MENVKACCFRSCIEYVGYKIGTEARKQWVTDEMIRKMDERRMWQNVSTDDGVKKYKQLNNELRRKQTRKERIGGWTSVRLLMR